MMGQLPDPDDIDVVVSGGDPDPGSQRETAEFIARSKRSAGHPGEVEEAQKILDALGIRPGANGTDDPHALLDHWRRAVERLTRESTEPTNGRPV